MEQRLEHSISEDLYQEAHTLSENDIVKNDISSSSVEEIREALSLIANYKGTSIWVINSDGEIILSTRTDISPSAPISIQGLTLPSGEEIIIRSEIFMDILMMSV